MLKVIVNKFLKEIQEISKKRFLMQLPLFPLLDHELYFPILALLLNYIRAPHEGKDSYV